MTNKKIKSFEDFTKLNEALVNRGDVAVAVIHAGASVAVFSAEQAEELERVFRAENIDEEELILKTKTLDGTEKWFMVDLTDPNEPKSSFGDDADLKRLTDRDSDVLIVQADGSSNDGETTGEGEGFGSYAMALVGNDERTYVESWGSGKDKGAYDHYIKWFTGEE